MQMAWCKSFVLQLVQSKKFVIDDSLLYNLLQASMVKPNFLKAIELAKPPFKNMFIEFSEKALFRAYKSKFMITQYQTLVSFVDKRYQNTSEKTRKGFHILSNDVTDQLSFCLGNNAIFLLIKMMMAHDRIKRKMINGFTSPKSVHVMNVSDKEMDFEKRVKDIRDNADKFTKIYKYRYEQNQD